MDKKIKAPNNETNTANKCSNCGATIKYKPGTDQTECEYCGTVNQIGNPAGKTKIVETDYRYFLDTNNLAENEKEQIVTLSCGSCGAQSSLRPNNVSDNCPFCGTALVLKNGSTTTIIRPHYLLPFAFDIKKATEFYKAWLGQGWFTPNDLQKKATNAELINGVYLPFWTYNVETTTRYKGEMGEDFIEEEEYTVNTGGGTELRTRNVTNTHWTPTSGEVYNTFKDILVPASKSLAEANLNALEPWDLEKLVSYDDAYLAGFRTEVYQVPLPEGFAKTNSILENETASTVKNAIGGDRQRVESTTMHIDNITFKHLLLPVYIKAYEYGGTKYQIVINARTGEVIGDRPISIGKLFLAIIIVIGIAVGIIAYFGW